MPPATPFSFFIYCSKPFAIWVVFSILVVMVASVIAQSQPLFYKWIIEAVEADNSNQALWLGVLYPGVLFVESILWRLSGWLGMKWTTHIKKYSSDVLMTYTLKHGHTFFSNRFAGSILTKVGNVVGGMETFVHDLLWSILGMVIGILVTIYFLFTVSTKVAWLFLALIVFLVIVNRILMIPKQKLSRKQAALGSKLRGSIADMLSNASVIQQFTGHDSEYKSMDSLGTDWRYSHEVSWVYSEKVQLLNSFILFLFFSGMMYLLVLDWSAGILSVAEFVFVLALVSSLSGRLVFVGRIMTNTARIIGEVEEGLGEVLVPYEIVDVPQASPLQIVSGGAIVWKDVNFNFESNPAAIFSQFNLHIAPGQRVGLVGASGAGKSTFVSLLLRQHDVTGGVIMIDGQNIAAVTQDSLRSAIAVVPQEPALFHRTIRENIIYGKPNATQEEIVAVAKKAHAHEFIMSLPEGYETMVGERGVKLSGGQKQRVAIARAMLKDAPILILDEATSALDSESEVEIQKALHILMSGKTVIAVAHRLSTLREMDRIIVLEQGKIIEDGTHETLKGAGGTYARLWSHQAGGFITQ